MIETEESDAMMAAQKARQLHGLKDWRPKKGGIEYHRKEKRMMKRRFSPTARERTERRLERMWNVFSWNLRHTVPIRLPEAEHLKWDNSKLEDVEKCAVH